jgi:hypothetical protein
MNKTNKDKKPETITSIINSLLEICKGHERYTHDTVKLGGFPKKYPITYAQVKDLANRLKAAQRREKKRIEQMVHELYWKNKNVLKWWPTLFKRDLTGKEDAINLKWCMMYAKELQHLIHWYGYEMKYAERDEKEPWLTEAIATNKKSEEGKTEGEVNKSMCDVSAKLLTLDEAIEHAQSCVDNTLCGQNHRQLAEWLIELDRLKTTPIGNIYALRQALVKAHTMLKVCDWPEGVYMQGVADLMKEIESAIDAPARNCDVGTAEEQEERYAMFIKEHWTLGKTALQWAQMPYKEGVTT